MGSEPTAVPRYPDISANEWARIEKVMIVHVAGRAGTALGDPRDIAREAVRRAQDPKYKEWDRSKKKLVQYVGSIANSLIANGFRKLGFKTTDTVDPAKLENIAEAEDRPDDAYTRDEARAIASARLARVREMVEGDGCCVILLDAVSHGEERPHRLAEAAGFTYRQVELAREKIERAALKVVAEEARAAKAKGYIK